MNTTSMSGVSDRRDERRWRSSRIIVELDYD
jgi:hypothetical protein